MQKKLYSFILMLSFITSCQHNYKEKIDSCLSLSDAKLTLKNGPMVFVFYEPFSCVACDYAMFSFLESPSINKKFANNMYFVTENLRKQDKTSLIKLLQKEGCKNPQLISGDLSYSCFNKLYDEKLLNSAAKPYFLIYDPQKEALTYINARDSSFATFLR